MTDAADGASASATAPIREMMARPRAAASGHAPTTRQTRGNGVLAVLVLLIVLVVPILLGGNRPVIWMGAATFGGAAGCWYAILLLTRDISPRVPLTALWPEVLGLAVFLLYCALQVAPLGGVLPLVVDLPGGQLTTSQLSLVPGDSWLALVSFVSFAVFTFLALQAAANRRRARLMALVLFAIVVAHALFALLNLNFLGDTVLGIVKSQYQGFATGTFVSRNSFATFVAAGLSLGIAQLLDLVTRERRRGEVSLWVAIPAITLGLLFVAAALLASGSRMGAISGVVAVVSVLALALLSAPRQQRRTTMVVAALVGGLLLAAVFAYGDMTLERLSELDSGGAGRAELYHQVIEAIMLRPWLGYGGGSFLTAFPAFQHPPLSGELVWNKAHSTYLALWFEYGVIFGSIPILVVFSLVLRTLAGLLSESSRFLSLAAIGVAITFAVHSIFDFSLEIQGNVYLMLAVLALGVAHLGAARRSARQE